MYTWAVCVYLAVIPLLCSAAPQAAWLSCATRPDNFQRIQSSAEDWPVGKIVVVEGFVGATEQDEYSTKIAIQAEASEQQVVVVASKDTNTEALGHDFVRVQGLATVQYTKSGTHEESMMPALRLQGLHEQVHGSIVSCPPPMHAVPSGAMRTGVRKLADAGCGGSGQVICTGAALAARDPQYECDFGFVGGTDGTCIAWMAPADMGCGSSGQPICTGVDLDGREPPYECDFGFVGGADGTCIPWMAPSAAACGASGQPICTGADLDARDPPYECDFGFVGGPVGTCIPWTPDGVPVDDPAEAPATPTDGACGGEGDPICLGAALAARDPPNWCDFGFVRGPEDTCIPFGTLPTTGGVCGGLGEAICTGADLIDGEECEAGLVGRVTETNPTGVCVTIETNEILDDPPPAPPPPTPTCGQGGQPPCTGDDLVGRTFPCDFGFILNEEEMLCAPFVPDPPAECGTDFEDIAIDGSFGAVLGAPLIPVASALLPSGKVLSWSGALVDQFGINGLGSTKWVIFDPATNSFGTEQTSFTEHDMFCPSIAMLADGRIHVGGGNNAEATSLYSASGGVAPGTWAGSAQMNIPRGYSSSVTLSNGQVFTNGGSWSGDDIINVGCCVNKAAEVWDPETGTWRLLSAIDSTEMLCDDPEGRQQQDYYGFFFAWTGASVFHAGPSSQMNWYTTTGTGGFIPAGTRGPTAQNGGAVMYEAGKILVIGGGPAFGLSLPPRTTAEVVEISAVGVAPTVRDIQGPLIPRTFSMSVVLPTGDVLHFGGNGISEQFSDDDAILMPELWNHESEQWQLLETPMTIPRTYHSSGVLVPDGRVYMGGGGLCFTCFPGQSGKICDCLNNHLDAEMYSPPYLFNLDGSPATRPTVGVSGTVFGVGAPITVTSNEPILTVAMVRMGSSTHSVNLDQRRLELCGDTSISCNCDTSVSLNVPASGIAIPGYYMVFAINAAGVPSVGEIVQVAL